MVQLQQQIAAAEAAAARVAELEAVKAQADALPALKRQLAAQQWVEQAAPAAEQAEAEARRVLAEVTPKMAAWRQRLEALYAELHAHVAELPTIQSEIANAARFVRMAASYRQGIEQHLRPAANNGYGNSLPPELGESGFDAVWKSVGGYNHDLQPLPSDDRLRYEKLVQWASEKPVVLYNAKLMGR